MICCFTFSISSISSLKFLNASSIRGTSRVFACATADRRRMEYCDARLTDGRLNTESFGVVLWWNDVSELGGDGEVEIEEEEEEVDRVFLCVERSALL